MDDSKKSKTKEKRDPVVEYSHKVFEGLSVNDIPYKYKKKVADYLKNQKNEAIKAEDFLSAQKFEDKINEIRQVEIEETYESHQKGKYDELVQRLSEAQNELEDNKENLYQLLQTFQDERNDAIAKLDEQLEFELYQFDEEHSCEIPPKFRKFSPEYLNIRKREKFMVSSKRYVEANNLKKEADLMEKKERKIQQKNWEDYVKRQRLILVQKQEEQRRCYIEKWDRDWAAMLPSAEAEVARCKNIVKNIENSISNMSNSDQMVATDGTALTASQTASMAKSPTRNATSRSQRTINAPSRNPLPPLNVSPTQPDKLRSRMTYMRATNYKISRQKKIRNQQAGSKRAQSSVY